MRPTRLDTTGLLSHGGVAGSPHVKIEVVERSEF